MADLQAGSFYVDVPQTGMAVRRFQTDTNFLAPWIAPIQVVKKPTGLYTVWRMSDLNRDEMIVRGGPSSPPAVSSFARDTAKFTTDARSLAYDLNAATQAASDVDSDPSLIIPLALSYKALINAELRVGTAFFNSGAWYRTVTGNATETPGAEGATTGTRKFLDDDTADPVKMFNDECRRQGKLTGQYPNALAMGTRFWNAFRNNAKVRAQLVTGTTPVIQQRPATLDQMAMLLELSWCGVSRAIYNVKLENEAPSNTSIIDEQSAVLYYAPGAGRKNADAMMSVGVEQPAAMARFIWNGVANGASGEGIQIRTYPDQNAGAGGSMRSVIDVYNGYGVVTKEMGTFFTGMTSV